MFDFSNFKKQISGLGDTKTALENKIEETQKEITRLKTSPPQRADVIEYYERLIARRAAEFDTALLFSVNRLFSDPMHMDKNTGMSIVAAAPMGITPSVHTVDAAIMALFGTVVLDAIKKRINEMPWTVAPGPRLADRPALIEKAEAELKKLEEQLTELRHEAATAGVII